MRLFYVAVALLLVHASCLGTAIVAPPKDVNDKGLRLAKSG